jgi:hypothetical protein
MKKYKIIEYKNKKNSIITYYNDDTEYYRFKNIFFSQGAISSVNLYADHNFFFSYQAIDLMKKNKSLIELNNFKKFHLLFKYEVYTKDSLYTNYMEMKKLFNEDYNYMADTYNYPIDKDIIEKKFGNYSLDTKDLWLIKPKNQCGGKGIKFLETLKKIDMTEFLISKYISNLDLINKKKYDLRLFILISGLRPLRIYFYKEGIVRIATKIYSINYKDIHNKFMHLTNYNVNSQSKNFVVPNETNIEDANIWNLQIYSNHLKRKNVDYNNI